MVIDTNERWKFKRIGSMLKKGALMTRHKTQLHSPELLHTSHDKKTKIMLLCCSWESLMHAIVWLYLYFLKYQHYIVQILKRNFRNKRYVVVKIIFIIYLSYFATLHVHIWKILIECCSVFVKHTYDFCSRCHISILTCFLQLLMHFL